MRVFSFFMKGGIALILATILIFGSYNVLTKNDLLKGQAFLQLTSVAESKADRVEKFLDERKADAVFLSESEDVKDIFDKKLIKDVDLMTAKIQNVAEKTSSEMKEYIDTHPDMTVEDLQNSDEFQSIAVQKVGNTGYTVIFDSESGFVRFHYQTDWIGKQIESIRESLPNLFKILDESIGPTCVESHGFYLWKDPDGKINEKFLHQSCVDARTADNVTFVASATTYVSEYGGSIKLASDLDFDMRSFANRKGYTDLIFINSDGDVIWTAEEHNELGTNLLTGVYHDSLLARMFKEAKKNLGVGISDSEIYGVGGKLNIFITAPVIDVNNVTGKKNLVGVVALRLDNDKIADLLVSDVGLGDEGEVYIVNREGISISPLKFEHKPDEKIETNHVKDCFKDYDNYYLSLRGEGINEIDNVGAGVNYAGKKVFGAHDYILKSNWCIIAEMDAQNFPDSAIYLNKVLGIVILILFVFGFFVSLALDSLYKIKRGNEK